MRKNSPMNGQEVRQWRESQGLSQAKLALALGTSTNTISRFERGETSSLSGVTLRRLEALMAGGAVETRNGEGLSRPVKPLDFHIVARDLRNVADILETRPEEDAAAAFANLIFSYSKILTQILKNGMRGG